MAIVKALRVKGMNKVLRNLGRAGEKVTREAILPVLRKHSALTLGVAQERVSIGDTGELRRNVAVLIPEIKFRKKVFGAGSVPTDITAGFVFLQIYAAAHHEGFPAAGGSQWPSGGQRKYAESAMLESRVSLVKAMARASRRAL